MSETHISWKEYNLLDRICRLTRLSENTKSDVISEDYQKHLLQLDVRLNELGLIQIPIGGDGNCFYLALCDQLKRHNIIPENYNFSEGIVLGICGQYPLAAKRCRFDIVLHMSRNINDYRLGYSRKQFACYLKKMRLDGSWAGGQEISAAADFYNVCIDCFSVSSDGLNLEKYFPRRVENESYEDWEKRCQNLTILCLCLHGNHFWSTRSNLCDDVVEDELEVEEEIVCQLFRYKGIEYLLGKSPESEKNKVYQRNVPNNYVGRLICVEDGENIIDFSVDE